MELRHLRYFLAVAEELNFTRAAARLHIGQPPLSMQIRDLEDEIGTPLFERSKRRVALTEAGRRFLDHAREILSRSQAAAEDARRAGRGELGELRVGFTSSLPYTTTLADVLYTYRRDFPQVDLQLREMFTGDQFAALLRGDIDVGLVRYRGLVVPPGVVTREIGRDRLRLVVNSAHPLAARKEVSLAECRDEGFIAYPLDIGTGLPAIVGDLCRGAGFEPRVVQRAREATTQIGLVASGLGVAVLPAPLECVQLPRVRYLAISDEDAYLSLAVARADRPPSPVIGTFLDVLDRIAVPPA
ncbi:LysR substrate-binding domain-containing protein [Azoarcus sp. DN11]|uniref:LysR substrate-binding domain-containing protein n=1 Tax=Azoarcus sp. DN11 TaxID=356837 RepID=UPI000EAF6F48|nr:LysR substrate-binding domain-containing protein [Azoarcus sp. DN11]AYH43361.1 LysR family transcriptional regulator [Azoarcus sp. DN11]